ncbi:MAG TPA: type II toxin-antitoxin system RelE/ParE family toxin [Tissierellaceae bacterium]|nr:type II toxin-antitoxin system RelE/ParE family toxin [Tissierellaceae bacterium]
MVSRNVYRIIQSRQAVKYIEKQDRIFKERIEKAYTEILNNPKDPRKLLKGFKNKYRHRMGSYRIIYSVCDAKLVIEIILVDSRGQVYNRH